MKFGTVTDLRGEVDKHLEKEMAQNVLVLICMTSVSFESCNNKKIIIILIRWAAVIIIIIIIFIFYYYYYCYYHHYYH